MCPTCSIVPCKLEFCLRNAKNYINKNEYFTMLPLSLRWKLRESYIWSTTRECVLVKWWSTLDRCSALIEVFLNWKYYMQRRRRLRRVAIPNSQALSLLGRDLREAHLQVLLGGSGYRSSYANSTTAAADPFLSSLILNFPASESEDISKSVLSADDSSIKRVVSPPIWKAR